jgi:hypothetical protein
MAFLLRRAGYLREMCAGADWNDWDKGELAALEYVFKVLEETESTEDDVPTP